MLHRLPSEITPLPSLTFYWQDRPLSAQPGDTVASALLLAGVAASRHSPVSGVGRLPFCMMGSCFECLVEVDGQIVQGCMTPVSEGMRVRKPEPAGAGEGEWKP